MAGSMIFRQGEQTLRFVNNVNERSIRIIKWRRITLKREGLNPLVLFLQAKTVFEVTEKLYYWPQNISIPYYFCSYVSTYAPLDT